MFPDMPERDEIPETRERYTILIDVFSFGIILWEMVSRASPWDGEASHIVTAKIKRGDRPQMPEKVNRGIETLINRCWAQDPTKRPNFSDIMGSLKEISPNCADITPAIPIPVLPPNPSIHVISAAMTANSTSGATTTAVSHQEPQYATVTPKANPPKVSHTCLGCGTLITGDLKFCDKCNDMM